MEDPDSELPETKTSKFEAGDQEKVQGETEGEIFEQPLPAKREPDNDHDVTMETTGEPQFDSTGLEFQVVGRKSETGEGTEAAISDLGTEIKIRTREPKTPDMSLEDPNPSSFALDSAWASMLAAPGAFTATQLQELEQQSMIYRYMAARVPVPTHLVLPIWKSVAGSSPQAANNYPSLIGLATLCLDFGKSPEPEPGRCRRTDGKKWRCWRNAIQNEKYCERHMHRGRKRPIQLVELDNDDDNIAPAAAATTSAASTVDFNCPTASGFVTAVPGADTGAPATVAAMNLPTLSDIKEAEDKNGRFAIAAGDIDANKTTDAAYGEGEDRIKEKEKMDQASASADSGSNGKTQLQISVPAI